MTPGASGHWLGTLMGTGGTATLTYRFVLATANDLFHDNSFESWRCTVMLHRKSKLFIPPTLSIYRFLFGSRFLPYTEYIYTHGLGIKFFFGR